LVSMMERLVAAQQQRQASLQQQLMAAQRSKQ
jgi:hypothetical protein